jgi:hypothetical protein
MCSLFPVITQTYLETLPTTILFVTLDGFQRFVVALSPVAADDIVLDAELACKAKQESC